MPTARIVSLVLGDCKEIGEICEAEILNIDVNFREDKISQIVRGMREILVS